MEFSYDPEHLGNDVQALFADAEYALVVAPFITKAGLCPLIDVLAPGGKIDVVTRWDPLEIRAGASDPMIIDDVEATGGTVRLLPRLHAKVYLAGNRALVGSANATGPGLGFSTAPNIETLIAANADNNALNRLFEVVDALAARAERHYALQLVSYAATLPALVTASLPDNPAAAARWIPQTTVAKRVLECYEGIAEREDYRADLSALDVPSGLSPEAFRTHVGLVLQQGLIGRIYRECEGLQQWSGIKLMLELLHDAGIDTAEDPLMIWNRLMNWFKFYLQAIDSFNGGYTIKR